MKSLPEIKASNARKPAPKKPALALDPGTLRAVADIASQEARLYATEGDQTDWFAFARRLRARAARIERSRKS